MREEAGDQSGISNPQERPIYASGGVSSSLMHIIPLMHSAFYLTHTVTIRKCNIPEDYNEWIKMIYRGEKTVFVVAVV